jgi:LytS/YehU family sensor histidine kinase
MIKVNYYWIALLPLALGHWYLWQRLSATEKREKALIEELARASASDSKPSLTSDQLNPHFLFNALNTIRYFVRTNTTTAREMLLDLSLVLQSALRKERLVNLRDEFESGRAYLRLERARLGPRLEVVDTVDEAKLDQLVTTHVLHHLLQALVNAVANRSNGGALHLDLQERRLIMEGDGQASLSSEIVSILGEDLNIVINETTRFEWRLDRI